MAKAGVQFFSPPFAYYTEVGLTLGNARIISILFINYIIKYSADSHKDGQ